MKTSNIALACYPLAVRTELPQGRVYLEISPFKGQRNFESDDRVYQGQMKRANLKSN